jgi:hypothetical protein
MTTGKKKNVDIPPVVETTVTNVSEWEKKRDSFDVYEDDITTPIKCWKKRLSFIYLDYCV